MMSIKLQETLNENIPAIAAATRSVIIFISVLSLPLSAAGTLGLSESQTTAWILGLYGLSGLLCLIFAFHYRQPVVFTGNLFIIIFVTRLGSRLSFAELVGASMVAGAVVLAFGVFGISEKLQRWIPMPIVHALLAGAVIPFIVDIFSQLNGAPVLIGGTFLAFLLSRWLLSEKVPAIFTALFTGLALTALTGQFEPVAGEMSYTFPAVTPPSFTLRSLLSVSPVLVLLIVLPANIPTLRYLTGQGFTPPKRTINIISGLGTLVGSILGPLGISLSLPATSLSASPQAGPKQLRYRAVIMASTIALLVGVLAGIVVALTNAIPESLFIVLVGLAVVQIAVNALGRMAASELVLGPMFTFVIALSEINFLEFGSFFWALLIGIGVSLLLEREKYLSLVSAEDSDEGD